MPQIRADQGGGESPVLHGAKRRKGGETRLIAKRGRIAAETVQPRSEEHTSELQSLMRISYAVFCLKKKKKEKKKTNTAHNKQQKNNTQHATAYNVRKKSREMNRSTSVTRT